MASSRYMKVWHEQHPGYNAEQQRKFHENNPNKAREYKQARRARKLNAPGRFTAKDIDKMLDDQKWQCAICGELLPDDFHVDHVQPLAKGGANSPDNIQLLCPSCNHKKGAR